LRLLSRAPFALDAAQMFAEAIQFLDCFSSLKFHQLYPVAHLHPADSAIRNQKPHSMAIK
jgi:hypothetical protein